MKGLPLSFMDSPTNAIATSERQLAASTRFGNLGRAMVAAAVVAELLAVTLSGTSTLSAALQGNLAQAHGAWASTLAVVFILAGGAFIILRRLWARDAREPFRYTFYVSAFDKLHFPDGAGPAPLSRLAHDLTERICEGIPNRLSLLEDRYVATSSGTQRSHVHVRGDFAYRERPHRRAGRFDVEVRAWVRVGPPGQPEQLAPPVNYTVATQELEYSDYERILDRVYFSVTTAVYRQIRQDVDRKIRLLPSRNLRANAYLYEADDYVRSNTLDAYAAAEDLYRKATNRFEPWAAGLPENQVRRFFVHLAHVRIRWSYSVLRLSSKVFPRLGRRHVLLARARIGTARTLLYRRQLGGLSGERIAPIFEAPDLLKAAAKTLTRLPEDVPDRNRARFEALVLLALAQHLLGAPEEAKPLVAEAQKLDPLHAHEDPTLAFVSAQLQTRPVLRLQLIRAAVELAPRDQVAQYCLAQELEMIWRRQGDLEPTVATQVSAEYSRVIALNPGIIAGWTNFGYVHWLLGNEADAWDALRRGREYKAIKVTTFVSELDLGLARIAAERGDIVAAYEHFDAATAAVLAREPHQAHTDVPDYWHRYMSPAMLHRYDAYRDAAFREIDDLQRKRARRRLSRTVATPYNAVRMLRSARRNGGQADQRSASHDLTTFLCNAVRAYVTADHAGALAAYGRRVDDRLAIDEAIDEYADAARLNSNFIQPRYALVRLYSERGEFASARKWLAEIESLDPDWPEGLLADAEVAAEELDEDRGRNAVRRVLAAPWATPGAVPRLRMRKRQSTGDGLVQDAEVAARYVLDARDRRPQLSAGQVEALVVWARVLARHGTPSTSVAASAIGQLVEHWYFPNYAKVQEICGDAMEDLLAKPPEPLKGDLGEVRGQVVDNLAKRCSKFAKAAEADGDSTEAKHWRRLSKDIGAWKKAGRNDVDISKTAATSARTAYNNMMAANLRGWADLDPEDARTARRLETLSERESVYV